MANQTPVPAVNGVAKQVNLAPTRKVMAGGLAGTVTTIVIFVLNTYFLPPDKPLTAEIAAAITTVFSFIFSYLVRPASSDQITGA